MKIFISGKPKSGKTTLILEIIRELQNRGKRLAGILSPEIRINARQGFEIVDLASGKREILAKVGLEGPQVSKYGVNIAGIEKIVEKFLESVGKADVIVIDEIGKMELYSKKFVEALEYVLEQEKPLIATLQRQYVFKFRDKGELVWLTKANFESVKKQILEKIK